MYSQPERDGVGAEVGHGGLYLISGKHWLEHLSPGILQLEVFFFFFFSRWVVTVKRKGHQVQLEFSKTVK